MAEAFPESSQQLAPGELIEENLGWQFGAWGGLMLVYGAALLVFGDRSNDAYIGASALLAAGGACAYYELWRRSHRTGVCVREPKLGIYRRGRLDMEVTRPEIQIFLTNAINTMKFAMVPVMGAIGGGMPLYLYFFDLKPVTLSTVLWGLPAVVASGFSLASLIYTRHVWTVFRLPRKGRFSFLEDFCVSKSAAGRLSAPPRA